jgi:spermidine/putrescine transport system permease protein
VSEQSWKRARGAFFTTLSPPLFWLVAFFLVPLAVIWAYSFGRNAGLTDIAITGTLENYARSFEPLYLGILLKSLVFAAITTALCLVIGFPVALALSFAKPKTKLWLLIGVMLPFWTNLLIRTYALMAVLRDQGYVNFAIGFLYAGLAKLVAFSGLHLPPFEPIPLLHNNFAVIFGLVYVQLPFMVLPLYAALDRMDRSLMEASLDLGHGHIATLLRIVVPLAAPGIASGLVLTFIPSLGSYLTPDLLGGPDSQMIANVIERQFKVANDWPFGAALSFLLMYLTVLFIAAQGLMSRRSARQRAET